MKPLVIVAGPIHQDGIKQLESEARVIVSGEETEAGMIKVAQEASGILFRAKPLCTRSLMSALKQLKVVGRHGVGHIGRRVAKTAGALGMRVIAYDKYVPADELRNRGVEPMPDLVSVLRQADVVTCHTPHTKDTHHMINVDTIAQMKPGVIFINTSRGKVQDEEALRVALESGKIRAAGIDVFEEEPVSSDSRLLQLDNVIVSPHIAGVTEETTRGTALLVTAEMLRVLRGEKPQVLGNPELWPKLGHLK